MKTVAFSRKLLPLGTLLAVSALLSTRVARPSPQAPTQADTPEILLTLDPAQSELHWTLRSTLHTVHGTFALRRGALRLDALTGKLSGEIIADATSGASGNDSRDKKMHKEILESQSYPEIVFLPDRVEGNFQQAASTLQIHGMFWLHGSKHEVSVPVQAELASNQWRGTAQFTVPYIQWGLKNPGNFFLKVDKTVDVTAELKGTAQRVQKP